MIAGLSFLRTRFFWLCQNAVRAKWENYKNGIKKRLSEVYTMKLWTHLYYMKTHCSIILKFQNSEQFRFEKSIYKIGRSFRLNQKQIFILVEYFLRWFFPLTPLRRAFFVEIGANYVKKARWSKISQIW